MVRRVSRSSFMGGTWVFPGGAVDPVDRSAAAAERLAGDFAEQDRPWRAAALRELAEEAGVWVTDPPLHGFPDDARDEAVYTALRDRAARFAAGRLGYFANWVTPEQVPVRFDTRFYAVWVDAGRDARPDLTEIDAVAWIRPADALSAGRDGTWDVPFPTMRTLEVVAGFTDPTTTRERIAAMGEVPRIEPRILLDDDGAMRVVLPGDPGYTSGRTAEPGSVRAPGDVG